MYIDFHENGEFDEMLFEDFLEFDKEEFLECYESMSEEDYDDTAEAKKELSHWYWGVRI